MTNTENISEKIQEAQNHFRKLEEVLEELDEKKADTLRRGLEDAEDVLEDGEGISSEREHIQTVQNAINNLQDEDDEEAEERLERLEDVVEEVEDLITEKILEDNDDSEEQPPFKVTVSSQTKRIDQQFILPSDLLEKFDRNPNDFLLYPGDSDDALPRGEEINLAVQDCFSAVPDDTGYGLEGIDETLETDIERLRESGFEVEVDTEAEAQFTHVIVRGYTIPSESFDRSETDVMIRAHENYPQKPPDWVYVAPDLRMEDGSMPRKSNESRVNDWLGLSWHINKINGISWEAYETDLLWYLENVVEGRLRESQ